MDGLSEMLNQILSTDEGKAAYEQLSAMLGEENMPNFSESSDGGDGLFGGGENGDGLFGGAKSAKSGDKGGAKSSSNPFEGIDPQTFAKFGKIFAELNKPDKNSALLEALKPHLRSENRDKIDHAMKLSRLFALLPYLKESGILDGFL